MVRLVLLAIIALLGILQSLTSAPAQTYPARTVRFIVPFGAASGTDITARLFADRLAARWGKPVLVENRPGGDGLVAVAAFIAANDDHTLLFAPVGTFTVHPYEHEKLPYDVERDLLPITSVSAIILAISSSASLKVDSLGELVELARAQPGKLNAAAANGNADFLLFGFLKSTGLQMAKVPYRDILQAPNDLAEGRIQVLMTSFAVVQPQMQTGRVKVLAVTSRKRAPSAPEVPTVTEAGYPALEMESLVGLFGPRGMSSECANASRLLLARLPWPIRSLPPGWQPPVSSSTFADPLNSPLQSSSSAPNSLRLLKSSASSQLNERDVEPS
jgi:tripartite-type tricarboxylate transporter receptor subunit TctC